MVRFCLLILSFLIFLFGSAQNTLGLPEIINYSKGQYAAGTQNWDLAQDADGIMYFANNEGLLSFDGTYWKLYPLPNKTIVRSLAVSDDGKIFVGGQDEIGFFSAGKDGALHYNSLVHLIPTNERSLADVWTTVIYRNAVFFRSPRKILQYLDGKISIFPGTEWQFMGKSNNMLVAQDAQKGVLKYENGYWRAIFQGGSLPGGALITSLTRLNSDSSLITTLKHGCFILNGRELHPWQSQNVNVIASQQISGSVLVSKGSILLSTNQGGCYVLDLNGKPIATFTRKEGLQNNNILRSFVDKNRNLWLGLDNGIDLVVYNNAIKHIYPDAAREVSGYSSIIHNNQLFLGTSNGVYSTFLYPERDLSFMKSNFVPVENTGGQVWNLSEVNGKLLLGHHEGAFVIQDNNAVALDKSSGFWGFLPYSTVLPASIMVAGNYRGLEFFNWNNAGFHHRVNAPFESARFICIEGNNAWVSHPYKGIYKVSLQDDGRPQTQLFGRDKGIPLTNTNYVFKIRNRVVVTSDIGVFEYNGLKDRFEPSSYFNQLFRSIKGIRYLKEDQQGNIWFVYQKNLGVLDFSGKQPAVYYITELTNKIVSGFEHVLPIDGKNIIVGAEKGFYHINYEAYKKNTPAITASIRSVSAFNKKDSLLFGGYDFVQKENTSFAPEIAYDWNTFHFEYSSALFGQQTNIEYSYLLEGFDKSWSEWTKKTSKEYTNVPAGNYSFKVKARNNLGNESAESVYLFTVLPPWYLSTAAYSIYILLFLVAIYFLYDYQKRKLATQRQKHFQEQKKMQYLHQLELEHNEQQIVKLKNEKLEAEIQHKNRELASVAMHLVQKGELLTKIKEELKRLKTQPDSTGSTEFKKIVKILQEEERMDDDWEQFALHFDKVHSDFLQALKDAYPMLTANELKLSAYLRMNLSSKEIAQLMNISVRGVEISRYRLRKKLGISTEVNLFNFLMEFTSTAKSAFGAVETSSN